MIFLYVPFNITIHFRNDLKMFADELKECVHNEIAQHSLQTASDAVTTFQQENVRCRLVSCRTVQK